MNNMDIRKPNEELVNKAYKKLNGIGIDFNKILQIIIDDEISNDTLIDLSNQEDKVEAYCYPTDPVPPHIQEFFDKLPKEEIKRRLELASKEGPTIEAKGIFEGMIWIEDNFDDPLDCLKDYMP